MTAADPVVSVVIPVLDPGPLLREQLDSLAAQDFPHPWEVLVVDDGCTDGSLDVVPTYADRLRVRVLPAGAGVGPRGPASGRNRGVRACRSEWVAFCDADDVAEPAWLRGLYDARDGADLVAGACDVTSLNDPTVVTARGGPEYGRSLPEGPCGFLPYAPSCNVLISRRALDAVDGWDETLRYCEDVDICWRAQLEGFRLVFAPDAVMGYRYRDSVGALFRQIRRYKTAEVALYRRFRGDGARRPTLGTAAGRWWWVLSRGPYPFLGRERRMTWVAQAGALVGRLEGMAQQRTWYP
ncbi:glycosyltransferase [Phycicoccus sp. HDW14]|uniref:glycosyltransferase family 2 protein n=1 Tax=Phycicoccus sp. HDW14 TaxID=2714941 RepID=UPI00140E3BB9|nr:glycosyltransferase [Phycicoccus sp. HDW14]QIM21707.1 glycosyltransferase [Phycicoccus sp. HDW14]